MDQIEALRRKMANIDRDLAQIAQGSVEGISQDTLDFKVNEGVEVLRRKCINFFCQNIIVEVGLRALAELLIPLYQDLGFTVGLEPVGQQDLLFTFEPAAEFGPAIDLDIYISDPLKNVQITRWQRSRVCASHCESVIKRELETNPYATEVSVPASCQDEAIFLAARATIRGCTASVVETDGVYSMVITLPPLS